MTIKLIDEHDLVFMREWWKAHGWTPPLSYMLSPTGILVSEDDMPLVGGWYIQTNSLTALAEWIVKNPKASARQCSLGLDVLYDTIENLARQDGYEILITFLNHPKFEEYLKDREYIKGDVALNTYIKGL
jgi:hypothetical protein